ncbi:hypothetical protein ZIOFF_072023 [Zingiber officinale]|uniref:Uncharacterized protein n=1 Tax=Zingiber officinale TaxID=94328 RepID=A0A8J5C284_ZINOF|nr:hypothetical protein ZIOFF_072023 [Zingiber officinale]
MRRALAPVTRRGNRGAMRERRPLHHLVVRKLTKLKMVVPGCRTAELRVLLRKTTEYVSYLELKCCTGCFSVAL